MVIAEHMLSSARRVHSSAGFTMFASQHHSPKRWRRPNASSFHARTRPTTALVVLLCVSPGAAAASQHRSIVANNATAPHNRTPYELGDPSCPCVFDAASGLDAIDPLDRNHTLGPNVDLDTFGLGCGAYDLDTTQCSETDECSEANAVSSVPTAGCDRSWCTRAFCYIDPSNCRLLNSRSITFAHSNRYYSYATCHDMDSFTQNNRLGSLSGRILRVGYNSNSGGWTGAYNDNGQHFQGPLSQWSGPVVKFVNEAAREAGFRIAVTPPPSFLREKSIEFFSPSMFDYCVYATALGYLDLCVAQYTVTDERAVSANWFLLTSQPLYLVVMNEEGSSWDQFVDSLGTIFQPFTPNTWLFIILFVIPTLGVLMIIHEYGKPGSAYRRAEKVMVTKEATESSGHSTTRSARSGRSGRSSQSVRQVEERKVPFYKHIPKGMYITLLSVLQQSYEQKVVSYGGMFHLLGITFFILTIIAVYTANLAAILTQQAQRTSVASLNDAIKAGYRLCGERKNVESIMELYKIRREFVVDPEDIGGDGMPGFNCAKCKARTRVFDFMDTSQSTDGVHCDAAIAPIEDLEVMQEEGLHCNKTVVGEPITYVQTGMPVYDSVSQEVISLFLKLKNAGVYDREFLSAKPASRCPTYEGGEGTALSVSDLTGIWIVSFSFAFLGLVVTCFQPRVKKLKKKRRGSLNRHEKRMHSYDQWGDRSKRSERHFVVDPLSAYEGGDSDSSHSSGDTDPPMNGDDSANDRSVQFAVALEDREGIESSPSTTPPSSLQQRKGTNLRLQFANGA